MLVSALKPFQLIEKVIFFFFFFFFFFRLGPRIWVLCLIFKPHYLDNCVFAMKFFLSCLSLIDLVLPLLVWNELILVIAMCWIGFVALICSSISFELTMITSVWYTMCNVWYVLCDDTLFKLLLDSLSFIMSFIYQF